MNGNMGSVRQRGLAVSWGMFSLAETGLIYKGIRPLQKLSAQARDLALNNPLFNMREIVPQRLRVVPPDPWAGDAQRGRDMIAGVFRFAGQSIERENLSWRPEAARSEWLAELHGFEFLRDLRSVGGDRARRMAREMVASWLHHYEQPSEAPCGADVTGARLAAWISFHDFFCASAEDGFRLNYFTSLVRQAKHLQRTLPGGLGGIALMRALKGLAYAGLALEDGSDRLEVSFKMILKEIREQILPDGAHVSRSPQTTFEFLQILVDLRTALTAARLPLPDELQHAIDRITPAVKFYRHVDGTLAQFNGGQEGNANICDATLMHSGAKGKAMKSLPHAGYEKICLGRSGLIMDVGLPPAAQKYAGRVHTGLLGFEYSYGKDKVITNCGTSAFRGKWRELLRATAAHSTVTIDNKNALQFDSDGFISTHPSIEHRLSEDAGMAMIEAGHDAYLKRYNVALRRRVLLQDQGDVLIGEESMLGRAEVPFAVRFHLHPNIQASLIAEGCEVLLRARSGTGWRFTAQGAKLDIEDSVYMCEGEMPRRCLQIVLSGTTLSDLTMVAWQLRREKGI